MASRHAPPYQTPPPAVGKAGGRLARLGHASPASSAGSLPGVAAAAAGTPPSAARASPRTPDVVPASGAGRPRSARSGSATPPSDDALSLASGTTASFSSAADACLFAPASTEDAVHAVPSLLSQLLSGRTDEQVLAARKLHAYCRHCGRPVEASVAAAGGVHMLLIMLDSLDRGLRDVCTRILTDLAADDSVRAEILSAPGGTAKVIQLMYRSILDGQASAGRFLELLAGSRSEAVQAALCHGKVVRMLCKTLGSAPTPRARAAALSALQAFCRHDPSNLRKLVWSGGVEALVEVLQSADGTAQQQQQHGAALALLGATVALQADVAAELATPAAVEALAAFVGCPEQPLEQQAQAADMLAAVAAVPVKREGVRQALTDHALPRAFEVVHEAAAAAEAEAEASLGSPVRGEAVEAAHRRRLQAAAAAIVAQLAEQDGECCHSLLFHAQLLRPAVLMLAGGGRCAAAQRLLAAARRYAASLAAPGGAACGGHAGSAAVAAAAPA
ncbi:hypothetical protein CHLNCDRAFT_140051 [Chlorella variabilis]|uniref:Armadillo repeat-containing domain-containing protein n=1 Tax=Chlorella variabilis TaxID=554065 RepID=E1ZRH2_CHLVA|nr:hypothetical protein CHLNCDRAFT_140051 [Chlorella variabilis]EFN51629.1 hypothetical protein CHLNCDRAFT_140051 [Chlorella variabilis]|eukprot:XP_005843731.1 hypothetical protein CHLNCDRAFT_140051 [Chlorella variabilis]